MTSLYHHISHVCKREPRYYPTISASDRQVEMKRLNIIMTGPRIYIQAGTSLYLLGVNANRCLWLAPESTSRLALLCTYWEWMQTDAYDWPQNLHPGWHFFVLTGSECKLMLMTGPRIYIQAGTSLYLLGVKANRCLWLAPESTSRLALLCTYWEWMQTDAYDWPQNLHPGWHFFVLTGSECKPMLMTGPRIYIQAGTSLYLLGVNANGCLWLAPESTSRLALLCTYWEWKQTDAYDWPQNLHPGWHFFVLTGSECKPMLMTGPRIYIQAGTSLYLLGVNANRCLWLAPESTSRPALLCTYWEWMQTDAYDWPQNLNPGRQFFVLTGSECKPMLMTGPRIYIQAGTSLYLLGVNANRCLWLAPESTSRLALLCTYWEWMQTDAYDWPQNLHPGRQFFVLAGSECKPMLMTGPRI